MTTFTVKEFFNDGYEDWCVNETEFQTEAEADKFADEVYENFTGFQQRVTVEESNQKNIK